METAGRNLPHVPFTPVLLACSAALVCIVVVVLALQQVGAAAPLTALSAAVTAGAASYPGFAAQRRASGSAPLPFKLWIAICAGFGVSVGMLL